MAQDNQSLTMLAEFLQETIKANYYLNAEDLNPSEIIDQIVRQLDENRFEWMDSTIYVPNLLTVYAPGSTPDKIEELEVLFNSVVFMKYLYEYMTETGYKLFDFVKVEIEPTDPPTQPVSLKFYWPSPEEVREDFTVLLNKQEGKIVEVYAPKAEISRLARLTTLNAETYRTDYVVTKYVTYIGRLRNVTDRESGHMLRRNDFVFARHPDPLSANSSVSRLHAKIVFEDNNFSIYDTGSANGTSITRGSQNIELPRAEISGEVLYDGDIINFGSAQVAFQFISEEEAASLVSLPSERSLDDLERGDDDTYPIPRREIDEEMRKIQDK
jgi:hypothetical protein